MSAPAYSNGYIPPNLLVTFNVGYSAGEGEWKHQLSPGTYAKHVALVGLARRNTGRTLQISAGWGAYRPFAAQVYAQRVHGRGAATPGTSSHGGFWERQQTLAIDYGNWSYVYNGSRDAFYRDVRAVGMEPGLISPGRGYPDEPWHVVDKNPWAAGGATAGGASVPAEDNKQILVPEEGDDMDYLFQIDKQIDGRWVVANYREGTMRVIPNGFQLDQLRAEKDMKDARPLYEFTGPQPKDRVTGLRVVGG